MRAFLAAAAATTLAACFCGSALAAAGGGRIVYSGDADTYITDVETYRYTGTSGWDPQDVSDQFEPHALRGAALFSVNSDGSARRRLTSGLPPDELPAWSPDGGRVVFRRDPAHAAYQLWVIDSDGRGARQLTPDDEAETQPSWSPDGRRIAFARYEPDSYDIYVRDLDGGNQVRLTDGPAWRPYGLGDGDPVWSPNGAHIAFSRQDRSPEASGIYVVDVDGRNLRQLTSGRDYDPDWSPDGRTLAFYRPASDPPGISTVNADGGAVRELTAAVGRDRFIAMWDPTWSPDGREVAFTATAWHFVAPVVYLHDFDIWAIGADGRGVRRITNEHGHVAMADWQNGPPPAAEPSAPPCSRRMIGTRRRDVLRGTNEGDRLEGRAGDDHIDGQAGDDCLAGQAGSDVLIGGDGADRLLGGPGNDRLDARDGHRDRVVCGGGRDRALLDAVDLARGCEHIVRRR